MDSNKLDDNTFHCLFQVFGKEYNYDKTWVSFLNCKDLGIKCTIVDINGYGHIYYKITDEKKWLLNKIKYGF
jgi:hypothetical protein